MKVVSLDFYRKQKDSSKDEKMKELANKVISHLQCSLSLTDEEKNLFAQYNEAIEEVEEYEIAIKE